MHALGLVYDWTNGILRYGFLALHLWAVIDCLTRSGPAFQAAEKLTKPAWLAILVIAGVFGYFIPPTVGVISLVAVAVTAVYLADVRPAVRDMAGG